MSSYFDITAATGALKELYDGQAVENLVYRNNPLLAMLPKKSDFQGKYKPQPIINGASQGQSAAFATAQSNQYAPVINEFLVTRKKYYSLGTIDNETMMAMSSDKGAFLSGIKTVTDGAFRSATNTLASAAFRAGSGSIGQISTITTGVIVLASSADVVQFELGMTLQANATDGGSPRAALGYVVAVNRSTGTITVSDSAQGGSAGSPSGWAPSDYLLIQGNANAMISGLAAWIPFTAPTGGDNFYGVNRSSDPTRLAGVRYDGSAQSIEEACIDASSLIAREGGSPRILMTNFGTYSALQKALGSKVQYVNVASEKGTIGFKGIEINGAGGSLTVLADRNCPTQYGYMLDMSTWSLNSLGDAPQILRYPDNNEYLRVYNADAAELRVGYYANLMCAAPGWNAVVKFQA